MSSSADMTTAAGRSNTLSQLPGQFARWWLGELAGLIPRQLKGSSPTAKFWLALELRGKDTVLIERTARGSERELGRIHDEKVNAPPDPSALTTSGLASLAHQRYRNWPLVVQLDRNFGLRKVVDLPIAAIDELGQLLQFELDRLTPFKAEDVGFAWRVLTTDHKTGRTDVELEMAPRAIIDKAIGIADHFGRKIERIEVEGDDAKRRPLDLLPRSPDSGEGPGWSLRTVQMATIVLLIVAVTIPLFKQRAMLRQLDAETTMFRQQAEESLALREELDALEKDARFLIDAKNGQPGMTDVAAELTRLFPDNSYLVGLDFDGSSLKLAGFAVKASDLIALLDGSSMLTSPQFQSPVVFDRNVGKERFVISADLVGRAS